MSYKLGSLQTVAPRSDEPLSKDQVLETKGIPWLLENPQAVFANWQTRLSSVANHVRTTKVNCSRWSQSKGLPKITQFRLKSLGEAEQARLNLMEKVGEYLGFQSSETASNETLPGTATEQGLLNYFDHITRDWAWGEKEIEAQVALVQKLAPSGGTVIVVGSGAGRLSYELRRQKVFNEVIALDINPLLLSLSKMLSEGQTLSVPEFPPAPRAGDSSVVIHKCKAPEKVTDLHFGLADAYDLPFAAGSVDFVLTPFLIDILPLHFEYLVQEVNRVLKTGGQWLSLGTLAFHRGDLRQQLVKDEVRDALSFHGFALESEAEVVMPFVSSPQSRQTRTELIDAWVCKKTADAKAVRECVQEINEIEPGPAAGSPIKMDEKIVFTPAIQQKLVENEIHFWIVSQIDGNASPKDIVERLVQATSMPFPAAEDAVMTYLAKHILK